MNNKKFSDTKYDDELCYTLKYFKDFVRPDADDDLILELMEPEYGNGFFYCSEFFLVGEVSEGGCGTICKSYDPRNGKNGRCKHSKSTFVGTGRKFKLTIDNKLDELKEEEDD